MGKDRVRDPWSSFHGNDYVFIPAHHLRIIHVQCWKVDRAGKSVVLSCDCDQRELQKRIRLWPGCGASIDIKNQTPCRRIGNRKLAFGVGQRGDVRILDAGGNVGNGLVRIVEHNSRNPGIADCAGRKS